jgi:hypothetical protein
MKASIFVAVASAALVSAAPTPAVLDARAPPNIPSKSAATTQLAGLTVAAQGPQTGYSRDLFPHWITQSGACNTRETVLKRDGTNVVTSDACAATSGSWFSPYDGATWTAASDVDIDHMVPLSNAWKVSSPPHAFHNSPTPHTNSSPPVRRILMDNRPSPSLRQRPHKPPAPRRHRQRQPSQGRQGPRGVETPTNQLLLHLQQDVDQGQERLCAHHYECREERVDEYVGYLLVLRDK